MFEICVYFIERILSQIFFLFLIFISYKREKLSCNRLIFLFNSSLSIQFETKDVSEACLIVLLCLST